MVFHQSVDLVQLLNVCFLCFRIDSKKTDIKTLSGCDQEVYGESYGKCRIGSGGLGPGWQGSVRGRGGTAHGPHGMTLWANIGSDGGLPTGLIG